MASPGGGRRRLGLGHSESAAKSAPTLTESLALALAQAASHAYTGNSESLAGFKLP